MTALRTLVETARFKKDMKLAIRRNLDLDKLFSILEFLETRRELPSKNRDHALIGNFEGCRECHISPDWLLI